MKANDYQRIIRSKGDVSKAFVTHIQKTTRSADDRYVVDLIRHTLSVSLDPSEFEVSPTLEHYASNT